MADLKGFTRDLMGQAERDLGTKLDWVAVDHWNTDNPHVHVLVRGVADDGRDLVIARDYIAQGLRARAEALIDLEVGPRTEHEIRTGLEKEVSAERWTGLDRVLQAAADENGGVLDLRPPRGGPDTDLRRLMIGRAQMLERLGLAEKLGPASWSLKPGVEATLRELGLRGDIIKTMHRAMADLKAERAPADFAIHGDRLEPIVGRLAARGLDDELKGTAFAVIDGVDGRVHHIRFASIEATTDVPPDGIVELRRYTDADARERTALAARSDLSIEAQVSATGRDLARPPPRRARQAAGRGKRVWRGGDRGDRAPGRTSHRRRPRATAGPAHRLRRRPDRHAAPARTRRSRRKARGRDRTPLPASS
jgi:type IV secretory pathway VirD2 relaxase